MYKKQRLKIITKVSIQTVVKDFNNGYGLAQSTVVCYADNNKVENFTSYRCNMLAKPARINRLRLADQSSFTSGKTAYIGNRQDSNWNIIPGMSMMMSRRDIATDGNVKWQHDLYDTDFLGLTLPFGYSYVNSTKKQILVQRINADYAAHTCKRQTILQQSIDSEVASGATFLCVQCGNVQVYSSYDFNFRSEGAPCSNTVTAPYAILTLGAYKEVKAMGFMTIYNKVNDNNPNANSTINTLSCSVTTPTSPLDIQALDIYTAYIKLFSSTQLENLTDLNLNKATIDNTVSCSLATFNTVDENSYNVLVASKLAAARSLDGLSKSQDGQYGIVQPDGSAAPCKVIPHNDPVNVSFVENSVLGRSVKNALTYAFAYTFNSKNTLQYNSMANTIISSQSSYNYGSILTTCITTIVAGLSVPIFTKYIYQDVDITKNMKFIPVILAQIIGSTSAAFFMIRDMRAANDIVTKYQISDTSDSVYNLSYYDHNMLINVVAEMSGKIHDSTFKIVLLILSMILASIIVSCKWVHDALTKEMP